MQRRLRIAEYQLLSGKKGEGRQAADWPRTAECRLQCG
nr:MAG TPA_asm: hypothetical protein [Caudoviricetes sp.]